jgi:hypothetical protein
MNVKYTSKFMAQPLHFTDTCQRTSTKDAHYSNPKNHKFSNFYKINMKINNKTKVTK